jgi:hypothetical protein
MQNPRLYQSSRGVLGKKLFSQSQAYHRFTHGGKSFGKGQKLEALG